MKCLLISDLKTEKSACSLNVNIGSAYDTKEFNGTAHLLEHMLFMGSKKYPYENEFNN